MRQLKKELLIFLGLFAVLSLGMHYKAWLEHPLQHLESLQGSPLGSFHPFVIVFGVYILFVAVRLGVKTVSKIVSRKR
ncbi:hypothetical protein [Hydrogenimonas sp.]